MLAWEPMLKVVHRLMLLILALAIVGGTAVQFARSAQLAPIAIAGMPCDMPMPAAGINRDKPMMPCKGIIPDCIKQMGCVTDVAVPARRCVSIKRRSSPRRPSITGLERPA